MTFAEPAHPPSTKAPLVWALGAAVPWAFAVLLLALVGCGGNDPDALFERLDPAATGVTFSNDLAESAEFNILSYLYYYNGGGVAAGDVDGDGRPDLYFTANEGPNALYLNRTEDGGPIRFEEATEAAGVAGSSDWTTGATLADVDGDGDLDLYVSALGAYKTQRGRNELFLNEGPGADGVPRFREAAAEVGLDFEGFGTQAAFFDMDHDGDHDEADCESRNGLKTHAHNFLADALKQFLEECNFRNVRLEHKYWDKARVGEEKTRRVPDILATHPTTGSVLMARERARIGMAASEGDLSRRIVAYAYDEQEDSAADT